MAQGFNNRSVLITGGSRGIGLATARTFLGAGANVTICGRSPSRLEDAATALASDRLRVVDADVSSVEGCDRAVTAARRHFGALDVLVTSAGDYRSCPIEDMTETIWDATLDTHLKGAFFCTKAAVRDLRQQQGAVVMIASDAGLSGLRGGWSAYCAAKGGLVNLTRQLAADLAPDIRVNCLAPGPVATEHLYEDLKRGAYGEIGDSATAEKDLTQTVPLHRIIDPEEVAEAILFVAASASMTGSIVSLDGGTTAVLP